MSKANLVDAPAAAPGRAPQTGVRARAVSVAACGKAILVGEHAVVYGARAIAMPVPSMQMTVKLTPTPERGRRTPGKLPQIRVMLGDRAVSDHLMGVVHDAFDQLGLEPFGCDVVGHSSVLIGAGLGSSASLCIVVLKALAEASGLTLSPAELAAAGNRLEKRFHGNPSGLDTAVVACEQVISFVKGQGPTPLGVARIARDGRRLPWRFALLDTGARSSTLAMIQVAAPYFTGPGGDARVARFDALADAVTRGLASGDEHAVAQAMNEGGERLAEAGVSNARIDEVVQAARDAGALAAKPTGAGGGGCVLALLDADRAEDQLTALRASVGAARVFGVDLA